MSVLAAKAVAVTNRTIVAAAHNESPVEHWNVTSASPHFVTGNGPADDRSPYLRHQNLASDLRRLLKAKEPPGVPNRSDLRSIDNGGHAARRRIHFGRASSLAPTRDRAHVNRLMNSSPSRRPPASRRRSSARARDPAF